MNEPIQEELTSGTRIAAILAALITISLTEILVVDTEFNFALNLIKLSTYD